MNERVKIVLILSAAVVISTWLAASALSPKSDFQSCVEYMTENTDRDPNRITLICLKYRP